jgi:hypothetical protein
MGWEEERFKQVLNLLPEGWELKAKELGALKRAREIKTPEELLRLILIYLTAGKSFAGTSALLQLIGESPLTKKAVHKRMINSADWLQWLCENIYRKEGLIVTKPLWLKGKNVIMVDGTEDCKCGIRRQCFMLHYCLDLFTLAPREFMITDMRTGEKLRNFKKIKKNDIVMGDRMYGTVPGIAYLKEREAGFVLRIKTHNFNIYNRKGQKIDLLKRFYSLKEGKFANLNANIIIDNQYIPIRVCAFRKDKDSERKGLNRLTKTNQRKNGGKAITELQSENNKYIIVVTSLDNEVKTEQVMELYRARWQIEIAFKRLKSLFKYNDLPEKINKSILAWFYGKLLLAALCETLVNTGRFSPSEQN